MAVKVSKAVVSATEEVDLSPVQDYVKMLSWIKVQREILDQMEVMARMKVQKEMGLAIRGRLDGRVVVRWGHVGPTRTWKGKDLERDYPGLMEQYSTLGKPSRRFSVL